MRYTNNNPRHISFPVATGIIRWVDRGYRLSITTEHTKVQTTVEYDIATVADDNGTPTVVSLTKDDGTKYTVERRGNTWVCDCCDSKSRSMFGTTRSLGCKHAKAIQRLAKA